MTDTIDFNKVYNEFYVKILHYLIRLAGPQEAEDIAQIVFEKVNQGLAGFRGEASLSTWIYRIATNTALDRLKSSSFKHSSAGPLAPLPVEMAEFEGPVNGTTDEPTSPDRQIIRDEMNECIREFVDRLPPDYRTVIVLNELEGFSNKEIAAILQISLDAAKIRLHRARSRLKKDLKSGCDFYHDHRSELACDRKQGDDNN